jgi:hypothetical protein
MSAQPPASDASMGLGLLMETAQTHQTLIEGALRSLQEHTRGLDNIVRAEIRRTLIEELGAVIEHAHSASETLSALRRVSTQRALLWSVLAILPALATGAGVMMRLAPAGAQLAALRAERAQLALAIEQLERSGGRIDLRRCGPQERLCVRIDKGTPAYGAGADYLIVKGY